MGKTPEDQQEAFTKEFNVIQSQYMHLREKSCVCQQKTLTTKEDKDNIKVAHEAQTN